MATGKILLVGHGGCKNRGCEAILRTTIALIRRYIGRWPVTVMSYDTLGDLEALEPMPDEVSLVSAVHPRAERGTARWFVNGVFHRLTLGIPAKRRIVNRRLYSEADVVISIGGDNFTDDYYSGRQRYKYRGAGRFFRQLVYAKSQGALTVIWGASIGPFIHKAAERRWAKVLGNVDLITVREPESLEYLRTLGVTDNVALVADPAFLLDADPDGAVNVDTSAGGVTVGIGMSGIIARYGCPEEKYIDAFASLGRSILGDGRSRLVLIPHVSAGARVGGDESVCALLAAKLDDPDRVTVVSPNHNACQMKHVIGACDYFIGARTHSTIASLSSMVPTLSVAYSTKAFGINRLIFGDTDYVLPAADVTAESLEAKYALLRSRRDRIARHLADRMPAVRSMAQQSGVKLAELLRVHGYTVITSESSDVPETAGSKKT